jgi:hypothetical protein
MAWLFLAEGPPQETRGGDGSWTAVPGGNPWSATIYYRQVGIESEWINNPAAEIVLRDPPPPTGGMAGVGVERLQLQKRMVIYIKILFCSDSVHIIHN